MKSLEKIILKIFKNIAIKNRIRKNLKNRANYLNGNKLQIARIGCIVDIEQVAKVDFLKDFIKGYGILSNIGLCWEGRKGN